MNLRERTKNLIALLLGFLVLIALVYIAVKPLETIPNADKTQITDENSSQNFTQSETTDWDAINSASKPISDELIKAMPKSPKGFKYFPQDKNELQALVDDFSVDLGDIDTSRITSMAFLFQDSMRLNYRGLDKWDTSSVRDMSAMFKGAVYFDDTIPFIDEWDTSKVENMDYMFASVGGGQLHISKWDTSSVTSMRGMFYNARFFNSPLDEWNVSKVVDMSAMFFGADEFAQDLNQWQVSAECNTTDIFVGSPLEKNPPLWFVHLKKSDENSAQR